MQPIRIGVLGAAAIARDTLIPAMHQARGVSCVAIASQRPGAAAGLAGKLGVPLAFDSYDDLLRSPEVDAVYIPAANGQHRALTERAVAHGKHVLCEKPLGCTAKEAEAMFAAAAAAGVRLLEAYSYHFHPQHQRVLELIGEGAIGTPLQVRARLSWPLLSHLDPSRLDVRLDPAAGGAGALLDHGCYCIHTARRIFGVDPVAVTAHSLLDANGVDVASAAILEYSGGRTAIIDSHFGVWTALDYEVLGPAGRINLSRAYGRHGAGTEFPVEVRTRQGLTTETLPFVEPAMLMVEHFGDLVRDPSLQPFTSQAETLGVMRTLDACARSARTGQRVAL